MSFLLISFLSLLQVGENKENIASAAPAEQTIAEEPEAEAAATAAVR